MRPAIFLAATWLVMPAVTNASRDLRPEFNAPGLQERLQLDRPLNGKTKPSTDEQRSDRIGREDAVPLASLGTVTSVAADVEVEFDHPYGIVRLVLVDAGAHEHLVYETYPALEDDNAVVEVRICEETCAMDPVEPVELRIQAVGAKLIVRNLHFSRANPTEDDGTRIARRGEQARFKWDRLEARAAARKQQWSAGETSMSSASYERKRALIRGKPGSRFLPNLQGYEFYTGGIFDLAGVLSAARGQMPGANSSMGCGSPIRTFDWRNRHGHNYMSPVRSQYPCGNCWAMAAIGAAEARINTYYNLFDAESDDNQLSVQEPTCVKGNDEYQGMCIVVPIWIPYADGCTGGYPQGAFEFMRDWGVPREADMPWAYTDDQAYCASARAAASGKPRWKSIGEQRATASTSSIKATLNSGPITACIDEWLHCFVIAGYEEYSCGTRWIIKNSHGYGFGEAGYVRLILNLDDVMWKEDACSLSDITLLGPYQMVPEGMAAPAIKCLDQDGDHFCNWGTGPKPASCGALGCYGIPDPDDTVCTPPACEPPYSCGTRTNSCGSVTCGCGPGTKCYDPESGRTYYAGSTCVNGSCEPRPCDP